MRYKNPEKMKQIEDYINAQYFEHNNIPTVQQISDNVGLSASTVQGYLYEMQEKGILVLTGGWKSVRTRRMLKDGTGNIKVAVLGRIACGEPLFAEENIESFVTLSKDLLGSGEFFALWARGNSMINAGINDGDLVIVRRQEDAENGQIVVALCDNENATLKRLYKDEKLHKIRLHPENDEMDDMLFDDIQIQGVAIKVLKNVE